MTTDISTAPTLLCPKFGLTKPNARKKPIKKAVDQTKKPISKNDPLGIIGICSAANIPQKLIRALKVPSVKPLEEIKEDKEAYQEARSKRFDQQRTLVRLFRYLETPKGASWNFHGCKSSPISYEKGVGIKYSFKNETASIDGTQSCNRAGCPHCAETKALVDKQELEAMRACHLKAGGSIIMMTLTNSHHIGHSLEFLKSGQQVAVDKLNQWISKSHFFEEFGGKAGAVRAWEKTYGNHGWHPHFHFLLYMNEDLIERDENGEALEDQPKLRAIRNSISEQWIKACSKAGLPLPDNVHGVDVRDGTHASKYVGKYGDEVISMKCGWGSDEEMSKPHLKVDKKTPASLVEALKSNSNKGITPWQLLELAHNGDQKAGELYIEYVYATYGTSQLYWYPKTKDLYDLDAEIEAKKQEQLALTAQKFDDNIIPDDIIFYHAHSAIWAAVAHCHKRSELLKAVEDDAENGNFEDKPLTWSLIHECADTYEKYLKDKSKNQEIIAPEDSDTKVRRKVAKKWGGQYGGELLKTIDKLAQDERDKYFTEPVFDSVPYWVLDVSIISECPPDFDTDHNYTADYF